MKKKINSLFKLLSFKIKENKVPFFILLVVWVITIGLTLNHYQSSLGMKSSGNDNFINGEENVVRVDNNSKVEEILRFDSDVESISIRFATYNRKNKGFINVRAIGETTKDIYLDEQINVNTIQDNAYRTFLLDKKNSKNELIRIELTSTCNKNNCVGVYFSPDEAFEEGTFMVNGIKWQGDIKVRFLSNDDILKGFSNTVIICSIIGITIIILLIILCGKYEILFATAALILGLIFMAIITPMSPPDEQTHYEYSFQLSNYLLGKRDSHIEMDAEYQNYTGFVGHANVSSAYSTFVEKINKPLSLKNESVTMINDIDDSSYSLCYIPQCLGITLARLLKVNMLKTFYTGRLFNLLFYVGCVYISIKKTPVHKVIFGLISTTPIMLQQASSYSYDTFLYGLMLIEIGYFLNWMFKEEKIKNREVIELLIVILLVSPLKAIYSLITLAFWFIPSDKFGSKKRKIISILILCVPIVIRLIVLLLPSIKSAIRHIKKEINKTESNNIFVNKVYADTNSEYKPINMEGGLEEGNYSIGYAIRNFKETIDLYYRTIRYNVKIWFYESIGRTLSGVSLILPLSFVHILSAILLISSFRKEEYVLGLSTKVYFVFACICIGLLAMAGMMITWTRPGDEYIQGIQGRYFSPLLPYFFTIFNNKKFAIPQKFDKYLIFAQVLVIFEVIIYVLSFTFVN